MKKLILLAIVALLGSCTENQRARRFGGKFEVNLPQNQVFKNATWKETSLWVLSEDTVRDIHIFREYSSLGIFEGEIIIKN